MPVESNRRTLLKGLAAAPLLGLAPKVDARTTPLSHLPAIGMGTWITFDVRGAAVAERYRVWRTFFELGGKLVDSSPMYGASPDVIGQCMREDHDAGKKPDLFSASKVWTVGADRGQAQARMSLSRWGLARFDLMQIHNMMDWEAHAQRLFDAKAAADLHYVGITTSHGRRHRAMLEVIEREPFDAVQFTYNIGEREAESRLLPAALASGKSVIINRPFATGGLFRRVQGRPLPALASTLGCATWAAFFLKFVISHPAVTLAIPATSRADHMRENMAALQGPMPDSRMRQDMVRAFEAA